jgi:hypothetical protein
MAYWIRLPDGSYVNTDTLSRLGPEVPPGEDRGKGRYRTFATQAGLNGQIVEEAAADALAAAIEAQIARQVASPAPDEPAPPDEGLERWMITSSGPPSPDEATRLGRAGEERALKAVAEYLASTGVDSDGVHHFVGGIRWNLAGLSGLYAGADAALPDVAPLGSRDEFPGIRQLDLRQGDDVLSLRYGGVDYVAAIKIRFGDAPEGFADRYLEISYHNPHARMWTLMQRWDNPNTTDYRFDGALTLAIKHDRAKALGE